MNIFDLKKKAIRLLLIELFESPEQLKKEYLAWRRQSSETEHSFIVLMKELFLVVSEDTIRTMNRQ